MSARAVVLTYHAIEAGPAPLCIEPSLFAAHLDLIAETGVRVVTLDRLADEMRTPGLREPSVAITFDDGCASVADWAAPLLVERGFPATVFCVAGHLGGANDWPSEPPASPRLRLASAQALSDLTVGGLELGSHGLHHEPLSVAERHLMEREILGSKEALEDATGAGVRWFAYPYGAVPSASLAAELVKRTYAGACVGGNRAVSARTNRFRLSRVDAHYLRRPTLFRRALEGADLYLGLRRVGGLVRRLARVDFVDDPPDPPSRATG